MTMQGDWLERRNARIKELKSLGFNQLHARGLADLDGLVSYWPETWGDDFVVLIYGDFDPPVAELDIPTLGITILPEKLENTAIGVARTVLKAIVKVDDKSVDSIIDAGRRLNIFLGSYALVTWGNVATGWWSFITHVHFGGFGGTVGKLDHDDLPKAIDGIVNLPTNVRKKVDAAIYWIRASREFMLSPPRSDLLTAYVHYWNAFELLVDAVNIIKPIDKDSKNMKQQRIDDFFREKNGRLTPETISDCYKLIVSPGFPNKAKHAIAVCLDDKAEFFISESFLISDEQNRLYDIRNSINHGDIDAENPKELIRVESRFHILFIMVYQMLGRLVPFPAPGLLDPDTYYY